LVLCPQQCQLIYNLGRPFRKDINCLQNLSWRAILMLGNSILDEGRL
jgi:hypothetical protein